MKRFNPFVAAFSVARLRQEIFSLGGRHRGDALAGALEELKDPGLSPERRNLLRAVVAHLGSRKPGAAAAGPAEPASVGLAQVLYVGVIVAAAAWIVTLVKSMLG